MDMKPRPGGGSFLARIVLPSTLAIVLFIAATFLFIIPSFERNMMDRKRETIRELNNSVHSLLAKYYMDEKAGRLTRAQAQGKAADSVRSLRYGPEEKDYFWITDLGPKMIMHPYRADLDGKDLSNFKDSHGKLMFVEFARIGRSSGAGYVDYMWQWKDDQARIVPKLSHVRLFEPWGWVTGTGIYIEDVREEIARLETSLITLSLLIAGIIALILLYVNQQSLRIERSRRQAEKLLSESEEKYRKLVEAATEGIMMVLDSSLVYSNRTMLDMLGYGQDEEKPALAGIFHHNSSSSLEYLMELLESGDAPPRVEATLLRKDGESLRALLTASKLRLGGREGFILTVKDIDRSKRTEEELSESREKFRLLTDSVNAEREKLLSELQLSLGSLNQSVRGVARKTVTCPLSTPIEKAARMMTAAGSSCILVESGGELLGVVTDHDLRARVLAGANAPGEPVSRIMSSPLISVPETALLFEAVLLMQENNIRHLAVRDDAGKVASVIDEKELLALKWYSPAVLMEEFAKASTAEEVVAVRARLPRLVKTLSDSGADSAGVTRLISAAADAATARFIGLAVKELGEPPVQFAFMALGSQARSEQTLATDQDNAIVYADPPPGLEKQAKEYFQALGETVCAWLDEAGYSFCKGSAMANNPKWCRPLADWKAYFIEWAGITDPQALLDINVFFDFRCVSGDRALETELREHVRAAVKGKKIFFLNLANNALLFKVPVGFRGAVTVEDEGAHRGTLDIKQLVRVVTDFARIYALRGDVAAVPTINRLAALAEANVLDQAEKESFSQAFETLMRLRLKRQAALAGSGFPQDNRIKPEELSQADQLALKEAAAAAVEAINKLKYLVKFLIV
jgi:PAS domain S-box-containing protein